MDDGVEHWSAGSRPKEQDPDALDWNDAGGSRGLKHWYEGELRRFGNRGALAVAKAAQGKHRDYQSSRVLDYVSKKSKPGQLAHEPSSKPLNCGRNDC
jgi:hypothetical protein